MLLRWAPIDSWPQPETGTPTSAPFRATYEQTLGLLEFELRQLDGENPTLHVDVPASQVRVDGQLRADARAFGSARVALAFDSRHGKLTYRCDAFDKWQDNVRAIALGLKDLRRLERYGIAARGEQYRGFAALGSGIVTGEPLTRAEAVRIVIDLTQIPGVGDAYSASDLDSGRTPGPFLEDAFRAGARMHHPDRGGNDDAFKALGEAVDRLREET